VQKNSYCRFRIFPLFLDLGLFTLRILHSHKVFVVAVLFCLLQLKAQDVPEVEATQISISASATHMQAPRENLRSFNIG